MGLLGTQPGYEEPTLDPIFLTVIYLTLSLLYSYRSHYGSLYYPSIISLPYSYYYLKLSYITYHIKLSYKTLLQLLQLSLDYIISYYPYFRVTLW